MADTKTSRGIYPDVYGPSATRLVEARSAMVAPLAFIAACLILFARRPDAVLHARFYAEDGAVFYSMAYNYGWWRVLFSPYQGYIHVVPRLVAGVATFFPFAWAPLAQNVAAIVVEAIPVALLLSPVCENWGTLRFRSVLALLYLAIPNCGETLCCITESQWMLALCSLLIVVGAAPVRRAPIILLLTLSSLTGPFCVFLAPIAGWMCLRECTKWRVTTLAIMGVGSIAQSTSLLLSAHRFHPVLGASIGALLRILAGQIYLGTMLGPNLYGTSMSRVVVFVAIAGTAFILSCFVTGNREMRVLLAFSAAVFAASIATPLIYPPPGHSAWDALAGNAESRYWFFPCLAFVWAIACSARSLNKPLRAISYIFAVLIVFGTCRDFQQHWHKANNFPLYAEQFKNAPHGATVVVPLFPDGWKAVLLKH